MKMFRGCFWVLLFSSCSPGVVTKYYDPALLKNDISYQPKPMSGDSLKSAVYASVGFNQRERGSESSEKYDMINIFQADLNRAHTFQYLNWSYGVFGTAGYIKNGLINEGEPFYFDKKSFSAAGLRGSVNTYFTRKNVDYRLLGLEFSYSQEFGNYADFRQTAFNNSQYYSVHNKKLFTAGVSSEVLLQPSNTYNATWNASIFGKDL